MESSFEIFDHTADMGFRVRAATMPGLVEPAGKALYAIIGELVAGEPSDPLRFEASGEDPSVLLRDYLDELLVLFERGQVIVVRPVVEAFDASRLVIVGETARIDPERSAFHREVKAITYHELDIRKIAGGFEATVIVDI